MKKKLILLFIIVVCFPIILSIILSSNLVTGGIESMLNKRALSSLQVASNVFEQFNDDISLKARIISQLDDIRNTIIKKDSIELIKDLNYMRQDLKINFYDGIIEIYDNSGNLLVSEPQISKRLTSREIINNVLKGQVKNYSDFDNGKLKITSAYPIYSDEFAQPIGLVSIVFMVSDELADEIKKIANTEIIFYSTKDNVLSTSIMINGERYNNFPEKNQDGTLVSEIKAGKRYYLTQSQLKKASNGTYYLAVAIDKTDVKYIVSSLRNGLYIIGMMALIFALLLAITFSRGITDPIKKLVLGVQTVGKGNLNNEVKILSNDEFQILAEHFDSMRLKIKDMIDKLYSANRALDKKVMVLSVINRINQIIIKQAGNELLKEILSVIVNEMNAERSSIMFINRHTKQLMLKIVYLKDEEKSKTIKQYISFDLGEGIAGYVAETGKTFISNDALNDSQFKKYEPDEMNEDIFNIICVPLLDDTGNVHGVINVVNKPEIFSDEDKILLEAIAHQIAIAIQNANLYELAITDGMTKLFIHRYFQGRLDTEIKRAERYNTKVSLIMLDIDHFKKFNDEYGHPVGDEVIKKVAMIIKNNIRESIDIASRYGGEEFAVILPETEIEGTRLIAERIRKNIEDMVIEIDNLKLKLTISAGCAEFPLHANDKESLVEEADSALYHSKENGRNRVTVAGKRGEINA